MNASAHHPAMRHMPPIGVMAPSLRLPVSVIVYNEPEKSKIPTPKSPATRRGRFLQMKLDASNAKLWYIWYCAAVSQFLSNFGSVT